jgi:hypothetical protein
VTATLPAIHFTAVANTSYVTELPPESEPAPITPIKHRSLWKRYRLQILITALSGIAGTVLLVMVWHNLPRLGRRLRAWQERRQHSETTYFRNLQRACTRNNATESYAWLLKWIAVAYPGVSLQQAVKRAGNPALTSDTNDLGKSLFAQRHRDSSRNGKRFAALLNNRENAIGRSYQSTSLSTV